MIATGLLAAALHLATALPGAVGGAGALAATAPALAGIVVDEAGAPVAGAEVRFASLEWQIAIRTGPSGRFRIDGPPPGRLYRLLVRGEGYAPLATQGQIRLPRAATPGLRLVLTRGRTVIGRLVDGDGRPVVGARVELLRPVSLMHSFVSVLEGTPLDDGLYRAATDEDGRYSIPGVSLARAQRVVRAAGFPTWVGPPEDLIAGPGGLVDLGTRTLDPGQAFDLWLTDPGGRPVAGVQVWETGAPEAERHSEGYPKEIGPLAVSGDDGLAHLVLSTGSRALTLCREGFLARQLVASAASPEIVFLQPVGRIAGRVIAADGSPVAI
jgi:Carboxypeptidase regulatory-like domain